MMYGKADINFYRLLGIGKFADGTVIEEAAKSKIAEWRQKTSDNTADDDYYTVIRNRCSLARAVLLDSNNKRDYDDWLSKSDDEGKRCVQLLSRGVYEDAARVADDVVGRRDNIDKEWIGAAQWCLAAEAYHRAGDEKKFREAQAAVDTRLHHPAILELKGDFLLKKALLEAKKDILQVIEGKDRVRGASPLRDTFKHMRENFEKARETYGEMMRGGEVLCKDEYGISLDDVKVVSEGKQRICEGYIDFVNKFLEVMENDSDEKELAFTEVIDLIKVEIPKDLALVGLLQGHELPPRLAGIKDFYDVCHKAYNDRDVKSYRQRLMNAREKAIRAIIRLKILFIIEPIVLGIISFLLILFCAHFIKNNLAQPLGTIVLLSSAALFVAVVSWAYVQLVNVQNSQLERAVCNVTLKDKPCDDNGRVLSNIWDNIKIKHRFTLSSVRAYIKLAIVFFCSISVMAALLG